MRLEKHTAFASKEGHDPKVVETRLSQMGAELLWTQECVDDLYFGIMHRNLGITGNYSQ